MVPENYRVKFTKTGSMQFISHLDLCRTMRSAFFRAELPVWFSEGFNPHPKMVFALPLSIGTQSVCEFMDLKLNGEMSCEDFKKRLNEQTTDELQILEVYKPSTKFTDVKWAEYEIIFDKNIENGAAELFTKPYIVMKRSKSGEKETDITPYIGKISYAGNRCYVTLASQSESYLNPEYIATAISKQCNAPDYDIIRKKILLQNMESEFR